MSNENDPKKKFDGAMDRLRRLEARLEDRLLIDEMEEVHAARASLREVAEQWGLVSDVLITAKADSHITVKSNWSTKEFRLIPDDTIRITIPAGTPVCGGKMIAEHAGEVIRVDMLDYYLVRVHGAHGDQEFRLDPGHRYKVTVSYSDSVWIEICGDSLFVSIGNHKKVCREFVIGGSFLVNIAF